MALNSGATAIKAGRALFFTLCLEESSRISCAAFRSESENVVFMFFLPSFRA